MSGHLGSSVSQAASWVGTVTYMSPERITGLAYSFSTDVWALGLTLLEAAAGRFPYLSAGVRRTSQTHLASLAARVAWSWQPAAALGFGIRPT